MDAGDREVESEKRLELDRAEVGGEMKGDDVEHKEPQRAAK